MWILESNDPELVFRVLSRSLKTVGRAPRASFVVNAPLVSRLHCRLSMDDDNGLDVEDLGDANGTFVNGQKVRRAPLPGWRHPESQASRVRGPRTTDQ